LDAVSTAPTRRFAWLIYVVVVAAVISGCTAPPSPERPAESLPHRGGTLRLAQEAPRSLDPLDSDSVYESLPLRQIFDTLVTFDASLNLVPALAETWTISKDGTHYTFRLREDVRFHDGAPLRAEDVVFTFERLLRPEDNSICLAYSYVLVVAGAKAFAAGTIDKIEGVVAIDPLTVRIVLEKPYPSFLEVLTLDGLGIVPADSVRRSGAELFGRAPVGTGPFRVAAWDDRRLRLESNANYFAGAPYVDALEISFLRDDEEDLGAARFFTGELDAWEPLTESLGRLTADPTVDLYSYQELSLSFLGLNTRRPPLDQLWLRRAIAHALNRRRIRLDSPSVRREAVGVLPPGMFGYSPERKVLDHRPDEARRLLAQAGYPEGVGLPPIKLYSPSQGRAVEQVLDQIRSDLAAVGIRLDVIPVSWTEVGVRLENGTTEAFLLAWIADLTNPDSFLRSMFQSESPSNFFGYSSAKTDALLERAAAQLNPLAQAKVYRELERQILEQVPLIPLYHTVGFVARRDYVVGLEPGPLGMAQVEFEKVWIRATPGVS
jgi:ABC-type transport system substrate-binding protein